MRPDGVVFSFGGTTPRIVIPSISTSASTRKTSPTFASSESTFASMTPFGWRAPAARHVKLPSPRTLVSSMSRRLDMLRSNYRLQQSLRSGTPARASAAPCAPSACRCATTSSVDHDVGKGPPSDDFCPGGSPPPAPLEDTEPNVTASLIDVSAPPVEVTAPSVEPPVVGVSPDGPNGGERRRGWIGVVLVAVLVGAATSLGVGAGVAATIRAHNSATVEFSPNTSVFGRMTDVQAVLARVLPSVVAIQAFGPGCATGPFGGGTQSEEGSGMILTPGGEILTNDHVIANATQIRVTFHGQKTAYPATLLGTDPVYDVALLQVHGPTTLRAVSFGDSSKVKVGVDVLAIGNALALSQSTPSVTEGIISAEGRSITAGGGNCQGTESLRGLLQTQAPINAGNSGGPLVNSAGQVIGMNTAAATSTAGDAPTQNIGFAIPIAKIRPLIPGLRKGGMIGKPKAFLGVEVVSVTPAERVGRGLTATRGALVVSVLPLGPAALGGIAVGDVIVSFAGHAISTDVALIVAVRAAHPGERVTIEFYRGAALYAVSLVLGIKPAPEAGSS